MLPHFLIHMLRTMLPDFPRDGSCLSQIFQTNTLKQTRSPWWLHCWAYSSSELFPLAFLQHISPLKRHLALLLKLSCLLPIHYLLRFKFMDHTRSVPWCWPWSWIRIGSMAGGSFRIGGFVFCKLMCSTIFVPFLILKGTLFFKKSSLMTRVSDSSQVLFLTQTQLFKYPTCLRWDFPLFVAISVIPRLSHSKVHIDRQYPYLYCVMFWNHPNQPFLLDESHQTHFGVWYEGSHLQTLKFLV